MFWCPHCAEIHRKPQREKAKVGLNNAFKAGYKIKMLTLTIPRSYGNNNFEDKFKSLSEVFVSLCNGLRTKLKRDGVKLYTMKGLDTTIDSDREDPVHLHIHSLIITDKRPSFDLDDWIWRTYQRHMKKRGIKVSKKGFDMSEIFKDKEITDYIVKTLGTMERELTSTKKDGRDGKSKGWWKWMYSMVDNPSTRDIQIYVDFLKAAKGKRTQDFSRNWSELETIEISNDDKIFLEQDRSNLEPIIEDNKEEEKTLGKYWCAQLDFYLWEAIKELKVEEQVLSIVDDYFDKGLNEVVFQFFERLIYSKHYSLIGEQRKLFYCQQIMFMLHWKVSMIQTKGEPLWQRRNLMKID